jgi:hypothetical protein
MGRAWTRETKRQMEMESQISTLRANSGSLENITSGGDNEELMMPMESAYVGSQGKRPTMATTLPDNRPSIAMRTKPSSIQE